ncbi:MAG: 4Fe-4S binding protein, partial [Myxococcota bacterium]|nr:4Fe-4S binding protein [Myxococcota bacterium]
MSLRDWFGTRLDPDAVLDGLRTVGVASPGLAQSDDGVRLFVTPDTPPEAVSRGLVWLREQLSPLTSVTVEAQVTLAGYVDERTRFPEAIVLAEIWDTDDMQRRLDDLADRLGAPLAPSQDMPWPQGPIGELLTPTLSDRGWTPGAVGAVSWTRPGAEPEGVRQATIVAASTSLEALHWLRGALADPVQTSPDADILLEGLVWGAARRPTIAIPRALTDTDAPIWTDPDRCTECGICEAMCPTDFLDAKGQPRDDERTCISCFECVDACPADAIRPVASADASTHARTLAHRGPWLSRLRGAPGPLQPSPFPPSYLLPRDAPSDDTWVLGLAILTMAEHAAVLLNNGVIVGAVEEEKLVRIRHYGRRLPGRPDFVTPAVDPTLLIEEALCHRSVQHLLAEAGITLDDLDTLAVNGLHGRYRH